MFKIAIYGKGGIGKSTITSNLSAALAGKGLTVMQIGCDPKADSTGLLMNGNSIVTVLDLIRSGDDKGITLDRMVHTGYRGVLCVEAGGPTPGIGCAGRGIITAFEKLKELGAYEHYNPDVILYDVLGDVVCGGFAMPLRKQYADNVYIVTSGEKMAMFAASNIASALSNFKVRNYAKLGGLILNRRNVDDEYEKVAELAEEIDSKIIADIPRMNIIAKAEQLGKTVIEAFPNLKRRSISASLPIEYWRIADITETSLAYFLPKTERFHTILHVPGSHTLYVGPSSCTRRHAIHAIEHGDDRRDSSFLFISEADVISGSYEEMIGDAVAELCEIIEPEPHIFFIAVFCIDDFLGTDEKAMLEDLHARFPGKQFVVDNIDPVTLDKNKNMAMKKHVNIFSFLEPQASKDSGVNFLGNFVSLEPECEFLHLLKSWGVSTVREIFHCRTYEEYQDMTRSQLSIVMRFMGEAPAKFMQENMGIPFYYFPPDYNVYDIAKGYKEIAAMLGPRRQIFQPTLLTFWQTPRKQLRLWCHTDCYRRRSF